MIKKALEYIAELKTPYIHTGAFSGREYTDKVLYEVEPEVYAEPFTLTTLSSLVEYLKADVDTRETMIVHIESPTSIKVFSVLDVDRKRENLVNVCANLPVIHTDKFIEKEMFNIALQSKFVDNEDKKLLLQFTGTVQDGTVEEYGDDGITQKATIKTGVASKSECIVPNPVKLKPFRTFTEVEQPESAFVFRMKSDKCYGITCAIFEADGGAWKSKAMENIEAYLKVELKDVDDIIIIS